MADAIMSVVAERLIDTIVKQIRNEVNLLRGANKEVLNLSDELKRIRNVLDDAEQKGFEEKSVRYWLKRLEDACFEMDDVLDEWDFVLLKYHMEQSNAATAAPKKKACSFIPSSSCLCFKKVATLHNVAKKIMQVKAKLDEILKEKDRCNYVKGQPTDPFGGLGRVPSTSFVEAEDIHGRDDDKKILLSKFRDEGASQDQSHIKITSIVWSGGIGKTTLAQLIYTDSHAKRFYPLRTWTCISDPFDVVGIAKGIVQKVQGNYPDTDQLDLILEHVRNSIQGKNFLLVLDDVWTEEDAKWKPLKNCLKFGEVGSRVLVTTRNEKVAKMMGTRENEIHRLGVISDEDCWLWFRRVALCGRNEYECEIFKGIGKEITKKCKEITLGSMLRFKYRLEEGKMYWKVKYGN